MKMQKWAIAILLSAGLASLWGCGKDDVKPTSVEQVYAQKVNDGAETPPVLPPPPHK